MSSVQKLIFTPDNPCNTTITDSETEKTVYQVYTEHGKDTITYVKNATGEVIASWVWRDVRSDVITLGNAKPVPLSSWLTKSMIPFNSTICMRDGAGKEYKWKGNESGRSLEVFAAGDNQNAIARFEKSYRKFNKTTTPATEERISAKMLLDSRGQEIQDLIIIGFLALEKKRRATEQSTSNRADVLGTPPMQFPGKGEYVVNKGGV
ncbi:hypothetical protein BDQ17DRAFT_1245471 [Cyathus striatus]|nr:hypothetical protein BDQ17DRAFT_1245471 [Cyathus striatus]